MEPEHFDDVAARLLVAIGDAHFEAIEDGMAAHDLELVFAEYADWDGGAE